MIKFNAEVHRKQETHTHTLAEDSVTWEVKARNVKCLFACTTSKEGWGGGDETRNVGVRNASVQTATPPESKKLK